MICQRHLLIHFLGFVLSLVVVGLCLGEEPSQFRRACLVGNTSIELESALKKRGFLISKGTLTAGTLNTPHHAFNLIYYRGRVEQDGDKWNFSGEEWSADYRGFSDSLPSHTDIGYLPTR